MSSFQLEPLSLKELPDSIGARDFPFDELSMPASSVSETPAAPRNRIQELERMLADTQGKAAAIEQEAYDKAYAAGEKAGMALGQKRAEQILERLQAVVNETEQQMTEIRHASGEAVIDMAAQLSAWLIGELSKEDHSRLLALAENTAHGLPQPEAVKIAVSPMDFADFEKLMEEGEHPYPLIAEDSVPDGKVRVFNQSQDILVDPYAALADAVGSLKSALLTSHDQQDDGGNPA